MSIIVIDGQEVPMLVNAATSIVHQRIFDEDLLVEYSKMYGNAEEIDENDIVQNAKAVALVKRMGFTMAMQYKYVGNEAMLMRLTEGDFISWLSKFPSPFALENSAADIMTLYASGDAPTAEAKKEDGPQAES